MEKLLDKCDNIILGGGMIFTFYKAKGLTELGSSLIENDYVDTAKQIFEKANEKNVNLLLPNDIVLGDAFDANANSMMTTFPKHFKVFAEHETQCLEPNLARANLGVDADHALTSPPSDSPSASMGKIRQLK